MVSAQKAFSKEPPRRPLTDLSAVVEDFRWRYQDRKLTDQVVTYCRDAPNLREAIRRAVLARDANGKHHNHQSKVDLDARRKFGNKIWSRHAEVRRLVRTADPAEDWLWSKFDGLHELLDDIKPYGIGPVTVYDVAVRVGAYLGIAPRSVYMHAGVKQGYKALYEAMADMDWVLPGSVPRIPLSYFPTPLSELPADDVEDLLCTYREVFEGWGRGE